MEAGMDDLTTTEGFRKLIRPCAEALVERARRRLGSKMEAYRYVAEANGISVTWLRKFLSEEPMSIEAHKGFSLLISFLEMCDQLEQDLELERKRIAELKSRIPDWLLDELIAIRDGLPLDDLDEEDEEVRQSVHQ
jgi:hypothetical protein